MTKIHYCKKILENGTVCGEMDASKFESGRYSACKSCRNISTIACIKSKKEGIKVEKIKKIDPDVNLRWLIEDTIKNIPLLDGTRTIKDSILSLEEESSNMFNNNCYREERIFNILKQHELDMNFLLGKIQKLESENKELKNEISELKK